MFARRKMAVYSLSKARDRVKSQKKYTEVPLALIKSSRKSLFDRFRNYTVYSSEYGDLRPLSCIKFSPNQQILATGSWSGIVKLWDTKSSQQLNTLKGHNDKIGGISFHPQSTINLDEKAANIATGSTDNTIKLWSLESQKPPVGQLVGHMARVVHIDHHPMGSYLASASYDGSWRLWDIESCKELCLQEGHSRQVHVVKFQGDGSLLASAGLDGIGRVWDIRTGKSAMTLTGHMGEIYTVDWSQNGYVIGTGGGDNSVRIYDIRALKQTYSLPAHNSIISQMCYLKNGVNTSTEVLVTSSFDGSIKVWSGVDYKLINTLHGHEGKVMGVDVSSEYIASCGYDRSFKLYGQS
ncbi:U4/U6 small nuclear ribonucleoprotein Prp4 [Zancudomyces culisetae]|uniref:U4/U6 small nuclear ribonucleoprotein Prp4 n=1 Tax=Zancudomyces culisetae TaxID=1213189 RepID=A0A1R1PTK9_ZANCU|nr:U4/U6 small nuclear ribonucleoprotein Prp4 [Zancudomyces culisetae]|eukprot:OMH84298.1 U4/U6 small nuclear ribonucleoprotein Prp4 [Zancudomyces culisetae]